jgi:hypothetical protein
MAQVAGPYGLRVIKMLGDLPFSGGMHTYPLTANQTLGFFFGDPVGLINGQPTPLTASPTTTLSANTPIGVMMGAEYQDPKWGFVNSQFLPPNAIAAGATKVRLKIADAPDLVMAIQANGSVTLDKIGMNAAMVAPFAAGVLWSGNSTVALDASSVAATATLPLRIYDFVYNASPSPGASSKPGDPYTDVLVVWTMGAQRFWNPGGQ